MARLGSAGGLGFLGPGSRGRDLRAFLLHAGSRDRRAGRRHRAAPAGQAGLAAGRVVAPFGFIPSGLTYAALLRPRRSRKAERFCAWLAEEAAERDATTFPALAAVLSRGRDRALALTNICRRRNASGLSTSRIGFQISSPPAKNGSTRNRYGWSTQSGIAQIESTRKMLGDRAEIGVMHRCDVVRLFCNGRDLTCRVRKIEFIEKLPQQGVERLARASIALATSWSVAGREPIWTSTASMSHPFGLFTAAQRFPRCRIVSWA